MKYIFLLVVFISLHTYAQVSKETTMFTYINESMEEHHVQFVPIANLPKPVYNKITTATLDSAAVKLKNIKTFAPRHIAITEINSWFVSVILFNDKRAQFVFDISGSYLFTLNEN